MNTELYFLRSSEQHIVDELLPYSKCLDSCGKSLNDFPELSIYNSFYGYTSKDFGLYVLIDSRIAGGIWSRRLQLEHGSAAYINDSIPVLSMAVLPQYRRQGIGTLLLDQFLREASNLYEGVSVRIVVNDASDQFFTKHGFDFQDGSDGISSISGLNTATLFKILTKSESSSSNFFNPPKWMD